MNNPSLREEPRNRRAPIIPIQSESSILDWLESTGRLLARDSQDVDYSDDADEDLSGLIAGDDGVDDADDDDDATDPDE